MTGVPRVFEACLIEEERFRWNLKEVARFSTTQLYGKRLNLTRYIAALSLIIAELIVRANELLV